ncbi:MAG: glutamine amidotransferase [Clostridia bacterium]|nr:glutamine amidotransferase [Clostridia bacterium]
MEIKILHLFYDLMNLYGEYGNINILVSRLEDQNVNVTVDKKTIGDEIDFDQYDFIYCGSGTEKNQLVALDYLKKYKDSLEQAIKKNKFMLFTGNSFELFGNKLIETDGDNIELLNLIDFDVIGTKERITGDVILKSNLFNREIIGFINKQSYIENYDNFLSNVIFGVGADKENTKEGIRKNNFFGTYVIGPILIKNPDLLEYFVEELIISKNKEYDLKEIKYENEEEGYNLVLNELKARIK